MELCNEPDGDVGGSAAARSIVPLQPSRGPPPPDSSRAHHSSHSSTAISHQSQQQAQNTTAGTSTAPRLSAEQAHRYSLELRRQQEDQLRKQQERLRWQQEVAQEQRHQEEQEREREREEYARDQARRRSEEEAYLQQIAQAYGNNASPHPLDTQVHLGQDGHPYYTQGYQVVDQAHLSLADGDAEEYQRHQQMLDEAYHLVDGQDPLDLSLEAHGVSEMGATGQSPEVGMIKYESPLPLE